MDKISSMFAGLNQDQDGVWRSNDDKSVSYPESGHSTCRQVEEGSFWFRHRNRCIVAMADRFPPPRHRTIVDIGGGNGVVSVALSKGGFNAVLLEPGERGVQNALQRGLRTILCTTFQNAGFEPSSLPAAGLFDVLEHIEGDHEFLKELYEALCPGGRLYLTVPSYSWLWSCEDIEAGHFRRYTRKSVKRALLQAGFEINFASYLFWPLPLPIWLTRTIPHRLGRSIAQPTQEEVARYHGIDQGAAVRLLTALLEPEARRIEAGKCVPFGSSCLVAASRHE